MDQTLEAYIGRLAKKARLPRSDQVLPLDEPNGDRNLPGAAMATKGKYVPKFGMRFRHKI